MRILLLAMITFLTIHFIRIDINQGTIPQTLSYQSKEPCTNETKYIPITSIEGDTIASLFALYPDPTISFINRLQLFYDANPSFKLQEIKEGYSLSIPINTRAKGECS